MTEKILSGRIAIITGANQGLGREISKSYVTAGANVVLCARNYDLLEKVELELSPLLGENQKLFIKKCDVTNESEVNALVYDTLNKLGGCQILVNNAGIYGPKGAIEDQDWDEWKKTIEINVFGSVLMCRALIPHFKKQKYGKIIQLSGGGATKPLPNLSVYATSKAAIVRFADTLAEEVRNFGIDVNTIAPGALNTNMLQEILDSGPEIVGTDFYKNALKQKQNGGTPLNKGAELALFLASSTSDGITGKLISALWDKWNDWPNNLEDLINSDAYTLRRIIGRDRGFDWGDV
jgi:NAD(P)-dependent dehydrogenase (short-subunit alcohol dehydrogenase family)